MTAKRGRPRKYDPSVALGKATQLFWAQGFSATSLDELATATEMNRPSIYNAFGDKEMLYRKSLEQFTQQLKAQVETVLFGEETLSKALLSFFYGALDVYFAAEPALGCFVMCTAPAEAVAHPEVRNDLRSLIADLDRALAKRFQMAQAAGEWPRDADAPAAARMTQATLHSLAIRARSGESKASLRKLARFAVDLLVTEGPTG